MHVVGQRLRPALGCERECLSAVYGRELNSGDQFLIIRSRRSEVEAVATQDPRRRRTRRGCLSGESPPSAVRPAVRAGRRLSQPAERQASDESSTPRGSRRRASRRIPIRTGVRAPDHVELIVAQGRQLRSRRKMMRNNARVLGIPLQIWQALRKHIRSQLQRDAQPDDAAGFVV